LKNNKQMKFPLMNTRSIVIIGYCLLVALAMTGIVKIYLEVIKSHGQSQDNSMLKKELLDLSNTLTTMYQAEGTASLLAFTDENENLKQEYDSLTNRVFDQIDSLRIISTDPIINSSIDSLSTLLSQKRKYAVEMFELMASINKNVVKGFTNRTIISKGDTDKLKYLLANVTQEKNDTVQTVAEKKGLFRRLRDAVKSNDDTLTQISKSSQTEAKELMIPLLSDTIIDFINQIDKNVKTKNSQITHQLLTRQHELYTIKELVGTQINNIMEAMKDREYQANTDTLKEKNEALSRSTMVVAFVGLSALIVVIFFMSWTVQSLNKAQRLQKNIQEANKHAEKLLASREQLIYTITHDIKAPISSIIGFIDLLKEEVFSQKQRYFLNNMHLSASHILDLVRNLLNFHSVEKVQPQLTAVAFSPASLIHNIYESFLPLAQQKELTLDLKSSLEEKKTFLSDPFYIRQIVNNLLSNAIKFTQEKGKIFLVSSLGEQNQWKISVQDNGQGIDTTDLPKIFDEFVRLRKTEEKEEGTGLGLLISKQLATLLGGIIDVESQKGTGSNFTLTIPLTPVTENPALQSDKTADVSSGRILFVDDDRAQLNLVSELMKREEMPYICCSSAYEVLNLLQEKPVDIIFTDIHIPDMEGFELLKQIRNMDFPQAANIPIIALSADCQKTESEVKAAGFSEFLIKPYSVQQLLDIIEKYTSFRRKQDKTYSEKVGTEWQKMMNFVADDTEAATKIIDSFIEETWKDKELMEIAFQKKDNKTIKQISHKMLSLMRVISAQDVVSILTDFEKGAISKEKMTTLFRLLDETIEEVRAKRQVIIKS